MRNRTANRIAAALLGVHAALLAWAATKHSPSIDEVGHMAAGASHWHFGHFDLYRVNPPLVRLVATLPVTLLKPAMDWDAHSASPGARSEFDCGERFIQANGQRSFWLFTVARWACIPFSLLGGLVCYRWAGELYGASAGLLALALWFFCPNILAHGQMITPDVGAASVGAAACYAFWRWLRGPTWPRAVAAGLVLGAAELTKATFVVLYGIWLVEWVVWRMTAPAGQATRLGGRQATGRQPAKPRLQQAAQLAVVTVLSVYVINLGYAFEGCFKPLGDYQFISEALAGPRDAEEIEPRPVNRFVDSPLARVPVPLPANYALGIDRQKSDFERGYDSYLRGEWRHGGWWYYYVYGLAIKVPLGTWTLFMLAFGVGWALPRKNPRRWQDDAGSDTESPGGRYPPCAGWRDEFVLLLPAATILMLVSSQTGFNHHLRYVLPIFPFVFIWIGRLGRLFDNATERHRVRSLQKCAIALALG
ncbi:MAG: glycosyltransferase family 39 protein, partial [Pirellulales bacterium]